MLTDIVEFKLQNHQILIHRRIQVAYLGNPGKPSKSRSSVARLVTNCMHRRELKQVFASNICGLRAYPEVCAIRRACNSIDTHEIKCNSTQQEIRVKLNKKSRKGKKNLHELNQGLQPGPCQPRLLLPARCVRASRATEAKLYAGWTHFA